MMKHYYPLQCNLVCSNTHFNREETIGYKLNLYIQGSVNYHPVLVHRNFQLNWLLNFSCSRFLHRVSKLDRQTKVGPTTLGLCVLLTNMTVEGEEKTCQDGWERAGMVCSPVWITSHDRGCLVTVVYSNTSEHLLGPMCHDSKNSFPCLSFLSQVLLANNFCFCWMWHVCLNMLLR